MTINTQVATTTAKSSFTGWVQNKVLQWAITWTCWMIKQPEVQHVIVKQFENGNTALCRALGRAVEDGLSSMNVEANDVSGLDQMIDDAMSNMEVDADMVKNLDQAVQEHLNDIHVEASNVTDLHDAISQEIETALSDFEVEADNVQGLSEMIDEKLEDMKEVIAELTVKRLIKRLSQQS